MASETAYLTGGASGIGRATAQMLVKHGFRVFIADRDLDGSQKLVEELNQSGGQVATCAQVNVADWDSQVKAFDQAVEAFGRIDHVYAVAGIGERQFIPNDPSRKTFEKPDLSVLEIDLTGVLYTVALAVQQFRRQDPGENGFRGKIATVASICGLYAVPTVPIYTAAKHGVIGFVRSYGQYLPEEKITFNAVCPNVLRTNISTSEFYDQLDSQGLLVPLEGVVNTFEELLGSNDTSGACFEVGPNYRTQGAVARYAPDYLDPETKKVAEAIATRSHKLHERR